MSNIPTSSAASVRRFGRGLTACAAIALGALTACSNGPTELNAGPGRTLSVMVGEELDLRVQSIGPGEYVAPPQLSSGALKYLKVEQVGPYVPAGVTQLFHFRGAAKGTTIISFQHTGNSAPIVDTVDVR
jgi:hypothetical protein